MDAITEQISQLKEQLAQLEQLRIKEEQNNIKKALSKSDHPTISKIRILASQQQLIRIDNEEEFSEIDWQSSLSHYKKHISLKKNKVIIDSKSGYSGAGRGILKKAKKINLFKSLSAYGIPNHRHNAEISQELSYLSNKNKFNFTPHILPMFRGILSTIYVEKKETISTKKILNYLFSAKRKKIKKTLAKIFNENEIQKINLDFDLRPDQLNTQNFLELSKLLNDHG